MVRGLTLLLLTLLLGLTTPAVGHERVALTAGAIPVAGNDLQTMVEARWRLGIHASVYGLGAMTAYEVPSKSYDDRLFSLGMTLHFSDWYFLKVGPAVRRLAARQVSTTGEASAKVDSWGSLVALGLEKSWRFLTIGIEVFGAFLPLHSRMVSYQYTGDRVLDISENARRQRLLYPDIASSSFLLMPRVGLVF